MMRCRICRFSWVGEDCCRWYNHVKHYEGSLDPLKNRWEKVLGKLVDRLLRSAILEASQHALRSKIDQATHQNDINRIIKMLSISRLHLMFDLGDALRPLSKVCLARHEKTEFHTLVISSTATPIKCATDMFCCEQSTGMMFWRRIALSSAEMALGASVS